MATTSTWSFLQPWLDALASFLHLPSNPSDQNQVDDEEDQDKGVVVASIECWPDAWHFYQKFVTADKCFVRVDFPCEPTLRRDRARLQRVREALELFDRLAAVDNEAFASLLSQFLRHPLPPREGTQRRPHVLWPTWECHLIGALSANDPVAKKAAVTWGELFGCPSDPWEGSRGFRAAMTRLETVKVGKGGNRHNEVASNFWHVSNAVMELRGDQKVVTQLQRKRPGPLSREVNNLFELKVPSVAHLEAVGGGGDTLLETWKKVTKRAKAKVKVDEAEVAAATYEEIEDIANVTAALARTDMTAFKLANGGDHVLSAEGTVNAGFLFSSLIWGQSLGYPVGDSASMVKRTGRCSNWDVQISGTSGLRFGAIFSAFAEAQSIRSLTISAARADRGIYNDPAYWSWLAYAFWSGASISSVSKLTIPRINLTEEHVLAVAHVLLSNYPNTTALRPGTLLSASNYGYVDVKRGTILRPSGCESGDDTTLVLSQYYNCRAYYDASRMDNKAKVVVPGYGVCEVHLRDGVTEFVQDGFINPGIGCGIRSLSLTLVDVENDSVVPGLFGLIGRGLHTLSLDFKCLVDRQFELDLNDLAAACPDLKELTLRDWNVTLGDDTEALRTWGIKKLFIRGSEVVENLVELISDPANRMSRELVELEVSPNRIYRQHRYIFFTTAYEKSLKALDKTPLPMQKRKLSKSSRYAMISVVSNRAGKLRAAQYLDSSILSMIFAFAATPECRSVKVLQFAMA